MKNFLQWFVRNLPLMILSLILAMLAWTVAAEDADPTLVDPYPQQIPVEVRGVPQDMVVVGTVEATVELTVRAPRSVWEELEPADFTVFADLSGLNTGRHEVPVEVRLAIEPTDIVEHSPEVITVRIEPESERSVPVHVRIQGEPTQGYETDEPQVAPQEVRVTGPQSYVDRVERAVAEVSVQAENDTVEGEYRLRPEDDEGDLVSYVELVPTMTQVQVPISLAGNYRELRVEATPEGDVEEGYRITYFSVDPPTVLVRGAPDILAAMPGYVEIPINVDGAQSDLVIRPTVDLPPGVTLASREQVEVSVFVEPIETSETIEITPTIQSLEPGLAATVAPDTVQVILTGPMPRLEELAEEDVRVVLDLFDLGIGTHEIEPELIAPNWVTDQNVSPSTVQVEITTAPTPTPNGEGLQGSGREKASS